MDEKQREKLNEIIATWRQIGEGIESKPLITFVEHFEAALRRDDANAERLAKAMEREAKLREENKQLADEHKKLADANRQLTETLSRYDTHPEVRAAKRRQIEEQQRRLAAQAEALKDPE